LTCFSFLLCSRSKSSSTDRSHRRHCKLRREIARAPDHLRLPCRRHPVNPRWVAPLCFNLGR
jgi:hypothetical protein